MDWLGLSMGAGIVGVLALFLFTRANSHKRKREKSGSGGYQSGSYGVGDSTPSRRDSDASVGDFGGGDGD